MDRTGPTGRNPLEIRRAFARSRLEAEAMAATYEILVPTPRRQLPSCRDAMERLSVRPTLQETRFAAGA